MKATDSGTPQRVALYFRVSTDEQAKSGYSIPDQRRTLRERASAEGYTVVEEIADEGYSGASPDRPGILRIYELAEAGEVDIVLATKRDRFFRSRLYMLTTDQDLKDYGVTLVSLTDTGNMIGDSVMDSFAEYEHQLIRDRTASGKLEKARAGRIIGANNPAHGYRYVKGLHRGKQTVVGYEVDEPEMQVVRRIFSKIASGTPIKTLTDTLDDERVPTPKTSTIWSRPTVRAMIRSDLYKPHTVEELRALEVSDEVVSRLDADEPHGVYRYQGIPVPVPDAGIPLGVVLEARRRLESNQRPSKNAGRFWELSGGILRCSECRRAMQPHTAKGKHFYYRDQGISNAKHDFCRKRKMVRADKVEAQVWETVRGIIDSKHYVLERMEKHFEQKRRELHRPGADASSLFKRLDGIERDAQKDWEAYRADVILLPKLKELRAVLDSEREAIERELERTRNRDEELRKLDAEEAELRESILAGFGDLDGKTSEERREIYLDLRLRVEIGPDKAPRVMGVFPIGRYEDIEAHLVLGERAFVVSSEARTPRPAKRGFVGYEGRSTGASTPAGYGPAPRRRNPRRARAR